MANILIEGVTKSFAGTPVLRGVDLDVADGEFVVLVGPSGCGKSTLLRTIAGLERADAGTIGIGGRTVDDLPPRERDIAMVFQSYALYPHMSVADNMSYSLRLRKRPAAEIGAAVERAAGTLGLGDHVARRPKALSGGQRQRVAMGRAIVRKPRAFLFDEPLSNLDARLRETMRTEVRDLHRNLGATSVYVTHDQIEAMTMADRIVAMHEGVAQQIGTPTEIYGRPANRFVAGFIGSPAMNFLDARVRPGAGGPVLDTAFGAFAPPAGRVPDGATELTVGLRPEGLSIGAPGAGGPGGTIDSLEYMGATTLVHVSSGAHRLRLMAAGLPDARPGERVGLVVDPDSLHLFDAASGERVGP